MAFKSSDIYWTLYSWGNNPSPLDGLCRPPVFDEGGLTRQEDGTLREVHIPGPEEEEEVKPATVPYMPKGSKPEPKLEWRVGNFRISLMVDGAEYLARDVSPLSRMSERGAIKTVAKTKRALLFAYRLCQRESGRVEA